MKRLHLICNAHLDPAWMWDYPEGITAALATFRSAVNLLEEYDYIFCHNEALLYEWIEEHDPTLFARIGQAIKAGKWHVMGGWYLQPDCHMPSGESIVRQILAGQRYFGEKFGVRPTTALNLDSFGHTRGLVQILNQCGYDSYLICRPMPNHKRTVLPDNQFNWVGYDGSKIKVCRIGDDFMYCTGKAQAKEFIPKKAECWRNNEAGTALWGIGNHGGGPSRIDLQDVAELIATTEDYEIIHSTPERFFAEVHPTVDYDKPLTHFLTGCYSSVNSIKQAHIQLENKLFATEKICSVAELNGHKVWDEAAFRRAEKDLLTMEFHDALCGTTAADGEKTTLEYAAHATRELDDLRNRALLQLMEDDIPTEPNTYPIVVFNYSPFETETPVEVEFLLLDAIASDEVQYKITLTQDGKEIPCQVIKELSNINYDRRKRLAFKAKLKPLGVTRFVATAEVIPMQPKTAQPEGDIVLTDRCKTVRISRRTGLLESYVYEGTEYLKGGAFRPMMYDDNTDSWGWYTDVIGLNPQPFVLDTEMTGAFEGMQNVHVVEDGPILTEVESFFRCGESKARVSYKIYKDLPEIDVHVTAWWNEQRKVFKVEIPCALDGEFFGQTAYGHDVFDQNGDEELSQRYMGIRKDGMALNVFDDCYYGCSAIDGVMSATLLRGVGYCVHVIDGRPLIKDPTRYIDYTETGKHTFRFRLRAMPANQSEHYALEFAQPPYALNAFPCGQGAKANGFTLDDSRVVLTALYKEKDHTVVRLFNGNAETVTCGVVFGEAKTTATFPPFAIRTFHLKNGKFILQDAIL